MWKCLDGNLFKSRPDRHRASRRRRAARLCGLEPLEDRTTPAVFATFSPAAGVLSVFGDAQGNSITVSRNAAGSLSVNGGAVTIVGGAATVVNTSLIQVFGQAGNDTVTLDEANGTLPRANLFGGAGNDTITGASGGDQLFGEAGNDTLLGRSGNDLLFGGAGDDSLTSGRGDDQVFGQAGDDRLIWNPGDGNALNEGGAGNDTVEVIGGNVGENYTIVADGDRVRLDRVSPAPFFLDIGTAEDLVVSAKGGDDVITAGNGLAPLIRIAMDGGAGNDTLTGGDGDDDLFGGFGVGAAAEFDNDLIIGGPGDDTLTGGFGFDTFVWNPGDGSDTVTGGPGNHPVEFDVPDGEDTLRFNGSDAGEHIDISERGGDVRLTRDVGNVTMRLVDIEQLTITARGGADVITVNDLSGTDDLRSSTGGVRLDLAATPGGTVGDGEADEVIVNGSDGSDRVDVFAAGSSLAVRNPDSGRLIAISATDATDGVVVNGRGGDDVFADVQELLGAPSPRATLTFDGGAGNDTIHGSAAADVLIGGAGDDIIDGNQGNDVVMLGAGDDVFQWDPGDGSDTVEGGNGHDTMLFNGSDLDEKIDITADGRRVRLTRDVGNVTMDLSGLERVDVNARGGADRIAVDDLSGTDVAEVNIDLASPLGSGRGDGQADMVIVDGTSGNDAAAVTGDATGVSVIGLAARVRVTGAEAAWDRLTVNARAGDDVVDASGLSAGAILLTGDGGTGDDLLIGGAGDDTLLGGAGDDVLSGGPGADVLDGGSGDNIVLQD